MMMMMMIMIAGCVVAVKCVRGGGDEVKQVTMLVVCFKAYAL
jgi:hypothetical protein